MGKTGPKVFFLKKKMEEEEEKDLKILFLNILRGLGKENERERNKMNEVRETFFFLEMEN